MAVDKRSSRLGILGVVAVILLGVLGTRLWFLQGTQQAAYQAKVTASKTRVVYIPPERGRIFDAQGRILADNRQVMTIAIDWSQIRKKKNRDELFERLSGPLQVPVIQLQQRYDPCYGAPAIPKCNKAQIYSPLLPLPLKEDVDQETVNFLLERSEDYPGITVQEDWQRVYPYAPLASHVIGYMGAITADNIKEYRAKGYNADERVGQFGVELSMEAQLHGSWGKKVYEIDAAGNIVGEDFDQEVAPVAGQDIQLSIDLTVQQYAEQALQTELRNQQNLPLDQMAHNPLDRTTNFKSRVFASSKEWGQVEYIPYKAPAGAVVVEDYSTGQVVAMASYPTFDNRWQESGISTEKYQQLFPKTDDPDKSILVNRAIQGQYNMGSSIKPFVGIAAVDAGIITPTSGYTDEGIYTLESLDPKICQNNGGTVRCQFKNATSSGTGLPSKYGYVTLQSALAVSSDVFFYRIGEKFFEADTTEDQSLMKSYLQPFGFGTETGIQLPFEYSGRVPDTPIKQALIATGKFGKNEVNQLVVGDDVQVAIGQGLLSATPLQAVNAYSTLANGGHHMRPSIVKAIYAPLTPNSETPEVADLSQGTVVQSFDVPTIANEVQLDDATRTEVVKGLRRVITGPGTWYPKTYYHKTTGEDLFDGYHGIPIAGKTGTAQGAGGYPWNDSSAFGAFSVDSEHPYAVYAYLEKAGYGAKAAGPVVKCMFLALSDPTRMAAVQISDQLDITSDEVAAPQHLADTSCLTPGGSTD
ncbi:MAG: penicillin-binding transpeptidase domain-containing protein [Ilumatobacteraceae bacterium]